MKFMVIVKADPAGYDAGMEEEAFAAMARYNEELVKAGVMVAADGLLEPDETNSAVIKFSGGKPTVLDGPFAEAKEVVGGFWVLEVDSQEEVIEWVRKVPFDVDSGIESSIEIRPLVELEDFGDAYTDEIREREAATEAKLAQRDS